MLGPHLEVVMSNKYMPFWREAHFEVKLYKAHQVRSNFWKLRRRKSARRSGAKHMSSQNFLKKSTTCSDHFLTFRCRFVWQAQGIVHLVISEQNVRVL